MAHEIEFIAALFSLVAIFVFLKVFMQYEKKLRKVNIWIAVGIFFSITLHSIIEFSEEFFEIEIPHLIAPLSMLIGAAFITFAAISKICLLEKKK